MAEIWRLDDMTIDAIKGPEQGKKVMRRNDGGGLFLRVTKHTDKRGVERVSKSWEFFFTMNGTTSCTGRVYTCRGRLHRYGERTTRQLCQLALPAADWSKPRTSDRRDFGSTLDRSS